MESSKEMLESNRCSIQRSDLPPNDAHDAQKAQLDLIKQHFALRPFWTTVEKGVTSVKFV